VQVGDWFFPALLVSLDECFALSGVDGTRTRNPQCSWKPNLSALHEANSWNKLEPPVIQFSRELIVTATGLPVRHCELKIPKYFTLDA
jgi:hypothetical protein